MNKINSAQNIDILIFGNPQTSRNLMDFNRNKRDKQNQPRDIKNI